MKIYLLRHPAVDVPKSLCYGRSDVPLAPGSETAVEAVKPILPDLDSVRIYTSPATRCRAVLEHLGVTNAQVEPRLQELDFGSWEGLHYNELPEDEVKAWSDNFAEVAPPGGETLNDIATRAFGFWNELTTGEGDALLVTHTGWIRTLLTRLLETSPRVAFRLKIDYLGLTLLEFHGEWTELHYINRVGAVAESQP